MHALGFREDDLVGRYAVRLRDTIEHAVAGALGDFRQTVGTPRLGRLRDRDQQCGFAEREPSRLLAEIGMRGRAHAFEIAAVGREREIEREDVVLGERAFELDGPHGLAQLRTECAVGARLEQTRDLHGERGTARDDAPVA